MKSKLDPIVSKLKKFRTMSGITQREIAFEIDLSPQTIKSLELGIRKPGRLSRHLIEKYLAKQNA